MEGGSQAVRKWPMESRLGCIVVPLPADEGGAGLTIYQKAFRGSFSSATKGIVATELLIDVLF
jgi:hypothetical protein